MPRRATSFTELGSGVTISGPIDFTASSDDAEVCPSHARAFRSSQLSVAINIEMKLTCDLISKVCIVTTILPPLPGRTGSPKLLKNHPHRPRTGCSTDARLLLSFWRLFLVHQVRQIPLPRHVARVATHGEAHCPLTSTLWRPNCSTSRWHKLPFPKFLSRQPEEDLVPLDCLPNTRLTDITRLLYCRAS